MVFCHGRRSRPACYHTNVMLCIGTEFAMGGFHMVSDPQRRREVQERLWESGRNLMIGVGPRADHQLCGNALELQTAVGPCWPLSAPQLRASATQRRALEQHRHLAPAGGAHH